MKNSFKNMLLAGIPIIFGVLLFHFISGALSYFDPNSPTTVLNEKTITSSFRGQQISFIKPTLEALTVFRRMQDQYDDAVLWLGGSHLHNVVGYTEDDNVAGFYANQRAFDRQSSTAFLQHSLPNMNANEALYLLLAYLQSGLKPSRVVFGFSYDDLDDFNEIRAEIFLMPVSLSMADEKVLGQGIANLRAAQVENVPEENSGGEGTVFDRDSPFARLEAGILGELEENWTAYRERDHAQAWLAYNLRWYQEEAFRQLRSILRPGRKQSKIHVSKRAPLRPEFKTWNMAALESLIRLCEQQKIPMLLYVTPVPTVPAWAGTSRYDEADLGEIKRSLKKRATTSSYMQYVNLEKLIPWENWLVDGMSGQDLNYFHFNARGHALLGHEIDEIIAAGR